MEGKKLMIIDTDCGVDDARAIIMAVAKHATGQVGIHVIAITTVGGNVAVSLVNGNVLRVLHVCSRTNVCIYSPLHLRLKSVRNIGLLKISCDGFILKIPVYQGSACGIMNQNITAGYHGEDGLGNVAQEFSTGNLQLQKENAIIKMAELAKEHKGQVSMVALGPLTNLALAHRLDPQFTSNLKSIFLMGGNMKGS